jgi:hypothetical protein
MELRERMRNLPDSEVNETISIWNVREGTLDTGRSAALGRGEWQQALDLNREAFESKQQRGAPSLEQARLLFNDYGPLLRLQRYDEVGELLLYCKEVFERENSVDLLGSVFSALADLEDTMGRSQSARHFEETALRLKYIAGDPEKANISHFNLANYITKTKGEWHEALAHRFAAALISVATQSGDAAGDLAALVRNVRDAGPEERAALPADFAALCATAEEVEGVRFREMIERLAGGTAACEQLFQQVVAAALEALSKAEPSHE